MFKTCLRIVAIVALSVVAPMSAMAQTSGTQNFTVNVPTSVSITAPAAASITHDQTDNPQVFPTQAWVVKGNASTGLNVNFSTAQPFTHTVDNTFKRDCRLQLAVGTTQGPASWNVTTASDVSNYASGDNTALVAATSTGVGRANMNLTVSFITNEFGVFAAGDYTTTVTGTVAAN
jgi:hypothetical protein